MQIFNYLHVYLERYLYKTMCKVILLHNNSVGWTIINGNLYYLLVFFIHYYSYIVIVLIHFLQGGLLYKSYKQFNQQNKLTMVYTIILF